MQVDIKNIEILSKTKQLYQTLLENLQNVINKKLKELETLMQKIEQELKLSQNFLKMAQVYEKQRFAILLQKEAELADALSKEAAAIASGNPLAIAAATAYVAKKTNEFNIAKNEYNKAKRNRINMEKRVEIVKKASHKAKQLFEESRKNFHLNFNSISMKNRELSYRLSNANNTLRDYINETIIQTEVFFKSIGISDIEKELIEASYITKIEGKNVAQRDITFSPLIKDAQGRTNIERMQQGLAPIGTDGLVVELHHLKQKDNGVIIEVTNSEHRKYTKTLHRYRDVSEIDRKEFEKWRRKYWQNRAKDFE